MELYQYTYQIGSNDYFDGNVYTTIEEATKAFMEGFENPRADSSHYKDRLQVAKYILSPDFQTQYQYKLFKNGGKLNYLNYIK